eukprot:Polyplicarium_translucidae@DN459_c0_g1_i2.p1
MTTGIDTNVGERVPLVSSVRQSRRRKNGRRPRRDGFDFRPPWSERGAQEKAFHRHLLDEGAAGELDELRFDEAEQEAHRKTMELLHGMEAADRDNAAAPISPHEAAPAFPDPFAGADPGGEAAARAIDKARHMRGEMLDTPSAADAIRAMADHTIEHLALAEPPPRRTAAQSRTQSLSRTIHTRPRKPSRTRHAPASWRRWANRARSLKCQGTWRRATTTRRSKRLLKKRSTWKTRMQLRRRKKTKTNSTTSTTTNMRTGATRTTRNKPGVCRCTIPLLGHASDTAPAAPHGDR